MQLTVLGSGSSGNAVLVRGGGTTLLVDAGLSASECARRMEAVGLPAAADGVLVTHEHGDHVAHAARVARRFRAPILATAGTFAAAARFLDGDAERATFAAGEPFRLGALEVIPVPKPHDAADPVAFVIARGAARVGVFTDIGHADRAVREAMASCTALVLEANHDPAMLAAGPYPPSLKRRVGGDLGHLSNGASARALADAAPAALRLLVLAHLSSRNNQPALVRDAFIEVLGTAPGFPRWLSFQDRPTALFDASGTVATPAPRPATATEAPAA